MCLEHGQSLPVAFIGCKPNWDDYRSNSDTIEQRLEENAELCWKDIEPMFSDCGFQNSEIVSRMVRDYIYKAAIKQDKDEQARLHKIINAYVSLSVPNDKTKENRNCFRGALMEDFKPDTTLTPDEATKAATRMAERLVNLLRKLDKNSKGVRVLH